MSLILNIEDVCAWVSCVSVSPQAFWGCTQSVLRIGYCKTPTSQIVRHGFLLSTFQENVCACVSCKQAFFLFLLDESVVNTPPTSEQTLKQDGCQCCGLHCMAYPECKMRVCCFFSGYVSNECAIFSFVQCVVLLYTFLFICLLVFSK